MDVTFLTAEQIWGDNGNGQLDVIKKYGTKVAPTDLTVILGGDMTGGDTSEGDLTCASWSASSISGEVYCVYYEGDKGWNVTPERTISARPALPPSEASKISPSEARVLSGIHVAEYGEYPQTVADEETGKELERLHSSRSLRPTGKNYTFDSVGLKDYDTPFQATTYSEYELNGKKYIRVPGRPAGGYSRLSTRKQVEKDKPYWVQVQPIEWLMDPSGYWVSKKCLFAGIQFDTKEKYDGDFSKTFMKHYLDTYFAKEMVPLSKEEQERLAKQQAEEEAAERAYLEERLRIRREERDASKAELERIRAERRATEKRVADLTAERDRLRQQLAALKAAQPMGNRPVRQPTSTPRNPNDGR